MNYDKQQAAAQQPKPQPQPQKKKQLSFGTTYILGGVSACTAELCVYPMDMIKTRLQVTTEKHGMFRTGFNIIKNEGFSGLYMGFTAACYRHFIYSGIRYFAYEFFREKVFLRNEDGTFPLHKSILAAMSAGAIGQFVASPTDLVKVQMQTEGFRKLRGEPALYNGTIHCFRSVYSKYGFFGMWKGWNPNVQRAALVQLGDLTAYDIAKQNLLKHTSLEDNIMCHTAASFMAGLVSTIMSTPSDVLKTRIMTNPTQYNGTWDCLVQTVRAEGVLALYKGFFPIWMRMGPKALVFYLTFEQLRRLIGVSSW